MRGRATVVDLFAGAGGLSLGFVQAGFAVVGAAEVDPRAARTYEGLVGVRPLVADLSALPPEEAARKWGLEPGELTVLVGGPPCQGFTQMRGYRGAGDPRNALLLVYLDYVAYLRPKFVLVENVPGLAALPHGRAFLEALHAGLHRLGYAFREGELDAVFYGVPQRRRRYFLLGAREGLPLPSWPEPTHGPPGSLEVVVGLKRPWVTVREAIGHLPPLKAGERYPHDPMHFAPSVGERVLRFIAKVPKDGGSRTQVPKEEWLHCHRDHNGHKDTYGRLAWDRPAGVITSGCCNVSKGRFVHPEQDRAITPREAALLQGFPPSAVFHGPLGAVQRQIGNAVPPPLAKALALSIARVLERSSEVQS